MAKLPRLVFTNPTPNPNPISLDNFRAQMKRMEEQAKQTQNWIPYRIKKGLLDGSLRKAKCWCNENGIRHETTYIGTDDGWQVYRFSIFVNEQQDKEFEAFLQTLLRR